MSKHQVVAPRVSNPSAKADCKWKRYAVGRGKGNKRATHSDGSASFFRAQKFVIGKAKEKRRFAHRRCLKQESVVQRGQMVLLVRSNPHETTVSLLSTHADEKDL